MFIRTRFPLTQVLMAVVLGVASGVYIFKPVFQPSPDTTAEIPNTSVSRKDNNGKDL